MTNTQYPVVLDVSKTLKISNDVMIHVRLEGAGLGFEEDGKWIVEGVEPGGVIGVGNTLQEAHRDLLRGVSECLEDAADEASDFDEFHALMVRFARSANPELRSLFDEARAEVRRGALSAAGYSQRPSQPSMEVTEYIRREVLADDEPGVSEDDRPVEPLVLYA